MNSPRTGGELDIRTDAIVRHAAGACGCVQKAVGRSLNFVVDADVVEVFVVQPDANDVAGLLDGRVRSDLLDFTLVGTPVGLDAREDVDAAGRAAHQMNRAGTILNGEIDTTAQIQAAIEGGLGGVNWNGSQ